MRYILMTFAGEAHVDWWRKSSAEEKRHDIERTMAWFREHGAAGRIVGGEELGWPADARTVRKRGITDGPFLETKELLGGFIVVDVPDEATALSMAAGWPGLDWEGDAVEVRPAGSAEGEAAAQEEGRSPAGHA
ncbi:MAG TPA: YciI family protein [Candidatus Limnocylindrales bacterium]|nr:YciI family protein [Candidatus Limnocylindrales bacterium]